MTTWQHIMVAILLSLGTLTTVPLHNASAAQNKYVLRVLIDGLWALFLGNGASLGRADYLYWTAGFNGENNGGFGSLHYVGTTNPDPGNED